MSILQFIVPKAEAVARMYLPVQKVLPLMRQRQNAQNYSGKLASQDNLCAFCLQCKVLNKNGWGDCQDSTSALTTEKRVFQSGDKISFSIDLAITYRNKHGWHRLIHRKTGVVASDEYYWNEVPNSMQLEKKVDAIKSRHLWNEVKDTYLDKKNFYLRRNDDAHPSFIVYIETVNQICDKHHI